MLCDMNLNHSVTSVNESSRDVSNKAIGAQISQSCQARWNGLRAEKNLADDCIRVATVGSGARAVLLLLNIANGHLMGWLDQWSSQSTQPSGCNLPHGGEARR